MAEKEEKKSVDEKRFAIFSKDTIKLIADSVGISELTDQAAALLGEDASYRLREATQNGAQYMKHAKRKKLMTDDFNKALRKSDIQPMYGHRPVDSEQPWTYQHTKDGSILFLDEADVSLVDVALDSNIPMNPGNVSIKAHWLAVEGVSKSQQTQGPATGKPTEKKLSAEFQKYFENITNAILGSNEELMKAALTDLRTNSKIAQLLPYFVSFISNGVKTVSHDLSQLTKLLHTLRAILNNRSLYLEPQPYLSLLVQSTLHCLTEPITASVNPHNDHWVLRDYAARLLAQMVFSWSSPINHLMYNTLKTLKEILHDNTKPFSSHYGAVMGILMFGTKPVQEILIPHLPSYMPQLNKVIDDSSYTNAVTKSDAHKVYGAILHSVEFLLKQQIKDFEEEISKEKESSHLLQKDDSCNVDQEENSLPNPLGTTVAKFYTDMYDYFGDSLTMQLPDLSQSVDFRKTVFKPSKKDVLVSLADPEAAKTGEELLDEFMEQVRVQEEIRKAQLEREKLENIRRAREKQEREERDRMLREKERMHMEKEERRRQERRRAELEKELILKRREEEERLRMLKEQEEQNALSKDVVELNSSHSEEEEVEPNFSGMDEDFDSLNQGTSKHSTMQVKTSVSEPIQGIKLKITRGPNKNLHVKTVETMSPPQKNSPKPKREMSPLYKHSPKSYKSESSPLYKSSPKSYKTELSPHYKHSPKHSHSHSSKSSSKDSKHSKKKKQPAKSKVYDEFEFESDPEDFKPLPFKKSAYYSSEGDSSDGAGNRKPLTLKIKMKESKDFSSE